MSERHILIVEDNHNLGSAIERGLAQSGYRVTWVRDGQQALAVQRSDSAAVVVTDVFMPDMDGLELIQALRQLDPALPIVAMSGGSYNIAPNGILAAAHKMGAVHTLQKPFDLEELLRILAQVL